MFKVLEKKLKVKFVVNSEVITKEVNKHNLYSKEKQIFLSTWNDTKAYL